MADTRTSLLTALAGAEAAADDVLPIVDTSASSLKKITIPALREATGIDADLAASSGSSLVGFIQSGTGAVARTAQDKGRDAVSVNDFGAVGDGVADDTAAIQAMINAVGYFRLTLGTYKITDSLSIPASAIAIGAVSSGEGMEKSVINCVGMIGKPAIKNAGAGYYRFVMRDFRVAGDCDNAINMDATALVYQSKFSNLVLRSAAGSCLVVRDHFSTSWDNVHVGSDGGHGFEIEGGNSTVLNNCYAHSLTAGNGKAGYRIRNSATLIACNGLDSGDTWGIFGDALGYETDSINNTFQIRLIGCNLEDWATYAIGLIYTGAINLNGTAFVPKSTGTFEAIIKGDLTGAGAPVSAWNLIERGCLYASKGSTLSGASRIIAGTPNFMDTGDSNVFPDYFNTSVSLVYPTPRMELSGPAYQISATKFANLDADRFYGFSHQPPTTWTADATTFSVLQKNVVKTANTVATAFATATGGSEGQSLTLIVRDSNTTVNHSTAADAFNLSGGANLVCANGAVLQFIHNGTGWMQV
jgi:hypothetical protein